MRQPFCWLAIILKINIPVPHNNMYFIFLFWGIYLLFSGANVYTVFHFRLPVHLDIMFIIDPTGILVDRGRQRRFYTPGLLKAEVFFLAGYGMYRNKE